MREKRKNFAKAGAIVGIFVLLITASSMSFISPTPNEKIKEEINNDISDEIINEEPVTTEDDEYEMTWHEIGRISSSDLQFGEYNPGAGTSGWLSTFQLDYAETPGTVLANNATDWSSDATARGYVDTDDTETDLESEDPAYFVVRCRFNDTVKDGSDFIGSRCRVTLNVTGDETIDDVIQYGDYSGTTGGGIVSSNSTSYSFIWINFYWDDNNDGYRITDDGSLVWDIIIEAKY